MQNSIENGCCHNTDNMKATNEDWINATKNLKERRASGFVSQPTPATDYAAHLRKCGYGLSLLDVGCGRQQLKEFIPNEVEYYGLDAFPVEGLDQFQCAIEDFTGHQFDTVCAFAVLDNCREFDKACQVMKEVAKTNIIILTGIGIPVDKFHTFKLEHTDFDRNFLDWELRHNEEIQPKVFLKCYYRK